MPRGAAVTCRAVVIDDQAAARRGIRLVLKKVPGVEVIAEYSDAGSALDDLGRLSPDLAFVDIRMPGTSGIELLRQAAGNETQFILVTAHDGHAVTAFDLAAVDYVLKPFTDERLISATERALERIRNRRLGQALGGIEPRASEASRREARYVTVREEDRIHLIPVADLVCLHADGNRVRLVTADGEHSVRSTLKELVAELGSARFLRVHRSHAVNIDAVKEIQPWFNGDYVALMRNGETLRISRRYTDAILRRVL